MANLSAPTDRPLPSASARRRANLSARFLRVCHALAWLCLVSLLGLVVWFVYGNWAHGDEYVAFALIFVLVPAIASFGAGAGVVAALARSRVAWAPALIQVAVLLYIAWAAAQL